MKKIFSVSALLFLVILFYETGTAATINVDQTGTGNYTTIQEAVNNAANGDIIKVAPGFYRESVNLNKAVQLIGAGPNFSFIDATFTTVQPTNGIDVSVSASVYISGFTITASGKGINVNSDSSTTTIRNCILSGNDIGIYSIKANCILSLINNTIVSNRAGISVSGQWNSSIYIKGNIVAFNTAEAGIGLFAFSANQRMLAYNCAFQNTGGNYSTGVAPGIDDISQDPKFIDKDSGNFVLASDSPCINTGIQGVAYNDPDGTRNDIGSYSGPNAVSFWPYASEGPVVTELTVTPASVPRGGTVTIRAKGYAR